MQLWIYNIHFSTVPLHIGHKAPVAKLNVCCTCWKTQALHDVCK